MSDKLLTSWSPIIRWLLLPVACILCPLILSIIYGFLMPNEGQLISAGRVYHEISSFDDYWYGCIQAFIFGAGFMLPIIYLAPSHTKIVLNIVRSILLILLTGSLIWFSTTQYTSFGLWNTIKLILPYLCICAGLFIDKVMDIKE